MVGERIGNGLRSATREGPAKGVRCHSEHEREGRTRRRIEAKQRVGAYAGKERARRLAVKAGTRHSVDGSNRREPESSEREGVARRDERREQRVEQRAPVVDERTEEFPVRASVLSERRR